MDLDIWFSLAFIQSYVLQGELVQLGIQWDSDFHSAFVLCGPLLGLCWEKIGIINKVSLSHSLVPDY